MTQSKTDFTPSEGLPLQMVMGLHGTFNGMLSGNHQATVVFTYAREEATNPDYFSVIPKILAEGQDFIETRFQIDFEKRISAFAESLKLIGPTPEGLFQAETKVLGLTGEKKLATRGTIQLMFEMRILPECDIFNCAVECCWYFDDLQIKHTQNFMLGIAERSQQTT